MPAALSAAGTGTIVQVRLATRPVRLPAAAASALSALHWLDISGVAQAGGMAGATVSLGGHSGYLGGAAGMTRLPAMTAAGTATAMGGPGTVAAPRTLTLTPVSRARRTPLTCTTTSTVVVKVTAAAAQAAGQAAAGAVAASASASAATPGAPDTGGGGSLHPASDLPFATGGAAAVCAGFGIAWYALRRRRGLSG